MDKMHYPGDSCPGGHLQRGDIVEHIDMRCAGTIIVVDTTFHVAVVSWTGYGLRTEPISRLALKAHGHGIAGEPRPVGAHPRPA